METIELLKLLLPNDLVDHFELTGVKKGKEGIAMHLDEKAVKPPEHNDKKLESKGFGAPIKLYDFPIRDQAVVLVIRRRKWKDLDTGQVYSRNWELKHTGTSYTREFALFLKKISRY